MNCKYLLAAAIAVAATSQLSAQTVKAGIEAWQRANYAAAVEIWRPLAEQGDADAQFNLGQAYRLGRGVPTNLAAAKGWFERAANQGHVDAETTLGLLLFENGDRSEGLKWLKKAADAGEARALLVYGTALVNGDSVARNPTLGYAYVSRSAAEGLQPARDTLGQLDQVLPPSARKRGLALARELARSAAPGSKAGAAKPPSKVVQTASAETAASSSSGTKTKVSTTPRQAAGVPRLYKEASAAPGPKTRAPATASSKSTAAAMAVTPASGEWRIQLGAFSQGNNARALYKKLSGNPAFAGRQPFYVVAGTMTRLQVGPFGSKAEAEAACRKIGVSCFAVPAK